MKILILSYAREDGISSDNACELKNSISDSEDQELTEEINEQNLAALEWGDESPFHAYESYWVFPLLKNEITVTVPETGEECYLEEFSLVIDKYKEKPYDLERYHFYLFDADGNDASELCLFESLYSGVIDSMCIVNMIYKEIIENAQRSRIEDNKSLGSE